MGRQDRPHEQQLDRAWPASKILLRSAQLNSLGSFPPEVLKSRGVLASQRENDRLARDGVGPLRFKFF